MKTLRRRGCASNVARMAAAFVLLAACESSTAPAPDCAVNSLIIEPDGPIALRAVGATERLTAEVTDGCGEPVPGASVTWLTSNPAILDVEEGLVTAVGAGQAEVVASSGGAVDRVNFIVTVPPQGYTIAGVGQAPRITTELWVHGDYAYTGTGGSACGGSDAPPCETFRSPVYVWRVGAGADPLLVDSVTITTFQIADLEVSSDGRTLFVGVQIPIPALLIYDLADPRRPALIHTYDQALSGGVHTLELSRIDGRDYAFLSPSTNGEPMRIIDVTDPRAPKLASTYYGGASVIHDMEVRDGLAFLCHWDAGLVVLDVGNGIGGGTPSRPVELSRLRADFAALHNATYWPARKLLFLGEERLDGRLVVVDVADLRNPRVIGAATIEGGTPHNFWLNETDGTLHAAWYKDGLRAFDVSGDVSGDLFAGDREITRIVPTGAKGPGAIWGAFLHRGIVYAADTVNGLWALAFSPH